MTTTSAPATALYPVTDSSATAAPLDHEARLLAQLLDSARVVLVLGGSPVQRDALLRQRLQLQLTQPSAPAASSPRLRCVVHVNQWGDDPTATLAQAVLAALPLPAEPAKDSLSESLFTWGERQDTRFVVLLNGLEALFPAASKPPVQRFLVELADCISRRDVPVCFVLGLDERPGPALAPLTQRVPDLQDMSLHLRPALTVPSAAAPPPATTVPKEPKHPAEKPVIRSDDVYALINDALSRVATGAAANPLLTRRSDEAQEPLVETFVPPPPEAPDLPEDAGTDLRGRTAEPPPPKSFWRRLIDRLGPRAS